MWNSLFCCFHFLLNHYLTVYLSPVHYFIACLCLYPPNKPLLLHPPLFLFLCTLSSGRFIPGSPQVKTNVNESLKSTIQRLMMKNDLTFFNLTLQTSSPSLSSGAAPANEFKFALVSLSSICVRRKGKGQEEQVIFRQYLI